MNLSQKMFSDYQNVQSWGGYVVGEIKRRLAEGESLERIAQFIQGQGEMLDLHPRSIEQALQRWVRAIEENSHLCHWSGEYSKHEKRCSYCGVLQNSNDGLCTFCGGKL